MIQLTGNDSETISDKGDEMSADFQDYLRSNLHGISLEPPLFYNSVIGIRFELGVPYRGVEHPRILKQLKNVLKLYLRQFFRKVTNCTLLEGHMNHSHPMKPLILTGLMYLQNMLIRRSPNMLLVSKKKQTTMKILTS
ncbi:hypothetical protein D3C77_424220 [compost metagenome]